MALLRRSRCSPSCSTSSTPSRCVCHLSILQLTAVTWVELDSGLLAPAGGNLGRAKQLKSKSWEQKWKYAGQNFAIERVRGSDTAAQVFANVIPTFLVMLWSAAVLIWLLVRACCSSLNSVRSLRSELRTLRWSTIIGGVGMLYSLIGYFGRLGVLAHHRGIVYVPRLVALKLAFGWLLFLSVLGAWMWQRRWARKHANGQYHLSMRILAHRGDVDTYRIKDWEHSVEAVVPASYHARDVVETEITPFQPPAPTDPNSANQSISHPYEGVSDAYDNADAGPSSKLEDRPPAYRSPTPMAGRSAQQQTGEVESGATIKAAPSAPLPKVTKRPPTKGDYMRVQNP